MLEVSDRWEGVQLTEWAGSRSAVLSLLRWGSTRYRTQHAELMIQANDLAMEALCSESGMYLEPSANSGTMAILNQESFLATLRPWYRGKFGEDGLPDSLGNICKGPTPHAGALAKWVFSPTGLGLPWPYARELNYV